MHALSSKTIAVASLLVSSLLLASTGGCGINSDALDRGGGAVTETACATSTKAFDAGATPRLLLTDLPKGKYTQVSSEIYIEDKTSDTVYTRAHFLATPTPANPANFNTALRCHETKGPFLPISQQPAMLTDITVRGDGTYDTFFHAFSMTYASTTALPSMTVQYSGDSRSSSVDSVSRALSAGWNSSYTFVHVSGETYAFYGVNFESSAGLVFYGKATFIRTNL